MYKVAKIRSVVMLILSTLLLLAAIAYLALGNSLGIYRWQLGLLAVASMFVAISVFSVYFKEFYALFIAPRCPRCTGTLAVTELEVHGEAILDDETLPPIVDRMSRCTNCGGLHHDVYPDWSENSPTARQRWGETVRRIIYDKSSVILLQRFGLNDEELTQLANNWNAYSLKPKQTRVEWESMLDRMQREAAAKNRDSGMVFPKGKR